MAGGNYSSPKKVPIAKGAKGRSAFLKDEAAKNAMNERQALEAGKKYYGGKKTPANKARLNKAIGKTNFWGNIQGPHRTAKLSTPKKDSGRR